ncbi:MAG: hypothetical protein ACK5XN_18510, partial [Bacteroidota bacterium]
MNTRLPIIALIFLGFAIGVQTSLYAQNNIAPQATVTGSTCNTGPCSTLNDLNFGICGNQQMWVPTNTPPSTVPGIDWLQWDFTGSPRTIGRLVIHHAQMGSRFLTGALIQRWDGTAWVNHHTFSGLNINNCINQVPIPPMTTNRFRITSFTAGGTQLSNVNFREIELIDTVISNVPNPFTLPPIANFAYDFGIDTVWVRSPYAFVNTSTGDSASYWEVIGSSGAKVCVPGYSCYLQAGTTRNFRYTFNDTGMYQVKLVVRNRVGGDSLTKWVYVGNPSKRPTANFFMDKQIIGVSEQIPVYDISENGPTNWSWYLKPDCIGCNNPLT